MPTALITGITGQDGGYLTEALVDRGWRVVGVLRPGEDTPEHLTALTGDVQCRIADLQDANAVGSLMDDVSPDAVFNLAGISSVASSWEDPVSTFRVNAVSVAVLLEACWTAHRDGHPVRFLQASSAEIFSGAGVVPQDEQTPLRPTNPYGASKAAAHQLVQVFRARGLHAVNAILYNHESPRRPTSFVTRKITSAVAAIAAGRQDELVLGNLDARRDWGWAPDYVEAMVLASDHPAPDDYVIATGVSRTVADFAEIAFRHAGIQDWRRHVRTDEAFVRPTDTTELRGRPQRAADVLGWSATVPLEETVARMVAHDLALLDARSG